MRKWLAGLFARPPAAPQAAEASFAAGDWPRAAADLREVLDREPANPDAWNKLGIAYKELGEMVEASRCFQRTVELVPQSIGALCNAASAQRDLGRVEESLALLRQARRLAPDDLDVLSATLFTLNFTTRVPREEIFREHLETERILHSSAGRPPRRAGGGKLRIGYLSPDLRFHAVACFVAPLLEHHDRERFEVGCYYLYPRADATTLELKARADRWTDLAHLDPAAAAAAIRADGIDILVDLAGHTDWNGLRCLALRPAPVIATWLGYLNTTGLKAVDYRITDAYADPPGETERFHSETLLRLPGSQWCRQKPAELPEVAPLPARRPGAVRFGSFNKAAKLTADTLDLWARLLLALPEARLAFVGIEERQSPALAAAFSALGVAPGRLEFEGRVPLDRFRALHAGVDIALDPHPYSGATTTLDSLWMGVPVLTLAGEAPISRSSASILSTLGMQDWVARSAEDFVRLGARHAGDLRALASLRARLRPALRDSMLMDGVRFTRALEESYLRMWEETADVR